MNDDETAQEIIAKGLGFKSYDSFLAFPDSKAVIDGRGLPLLEDHRGYQLLLGESCINDMISEFNISRNLEELYRNITRFFNYVMDNFEFEYAFVVISKTVKAMGGGNEPLIHPDFMLADLTPILDKVTAKYRDLFITKTK